MDRGSRRAVKDPGSQSEKGWGSGREEGKKVGLEVLAKGEEGCDRRS